MCTDRHRNTFIYNLYSNRLHVLLKKIKYSYTTGFFTRTGTTFFAGICFKGLAVILILGFGSGVTSIAVNKEIMSKNK